LQCLTCKCQLNEREEQLEHYKGEWHRYNLKLRLLGLPTISELEFGGMPGIFWLLSPVNKTICENGGFRSRSASQTRKKTRMMNSSTTECRSFIFRITEQEVLSVYKKVLYSKVHLGTLDDDQDVSQLATEIISGACNQTWVIILLSAGHFAAAVFTGSKVTVHKTFHRYIVRAKRGSVQSSNDAANRNNTAKSAGASLRRHNEQMLEESIKQLLQSWNEEIKNASLIFIRIPQYRKALFYSGKDPLFNSKDSRIRTIPFVTRRPTFNEVQRVHQELFSVTIHGIMKNKKKKKKRKKPESEPKTNNKMETPPAVEPSTEKRYPVHIEDFLNQMFTVCKTSNLSLAQHTIMGFAPLGGHDPSMEYDITKAINFTIDSSGNTLLHIAAKTGHKDLIFLLLETGADPTIRNFTSFLPYCLCPNKEARNTFRRFRSKCPDKYDYKLAQIPSPLSEAAEEELRRKKLEKKKMQRTERKTKDQEKKVEQTKKKKEEEEKQRFLQLSDREKRLLAVEKRMLESNPSQASNSSSILCRRCFTCAESLFAKIPFEYLDFHFCSVACLKSHK
uniref:VLRF1 domain-containing protein n=1 Tax=Ciona savignyi TaxID=51511 RepID=H2ZNI1_CIOSA